jgi:hypothetical protein
MACTDGDPGPACEDLGDFSLPVPVLPPDEMGTPGTPPVTPLPQAVVVPPAPPAEPTPEPIEPTVLCSFGGEPVASSCERVSGDLAVSYCSPRDEPNACERPMTALVSEPETAGHVERAVVE